MSEAKPKYNISHTRAGTVSDLTLDAVTDAAIRAQDGHTLTDAEAYLILLTAPQLFEELRARRAFSDLSTELHDPTSEVIAFPGTRDNG